MDWENTSHFVSSLLFWVPWILFSLGLWLLSSKLDWKRRWLAWIPGLRYAAFGHALDLDRDGVICGALEVLFLLAGVLDASDFSNRAIMALFLLTLVLQIIVFIYRIRLFLRLVLLFGVKKRWVILWIFCKWLPLLILALGKRYQPLEGIKFGEDWEAGTKPAEHTGAAANRPEMSDSGLSVDLRERVARDFLKKRYLLQDISLDIPNGSLVMLLGGSGSGKTTFVNALIGYEKADADIRLNGRDVYKDYDQVKYRIGFVPQQNLIRGNDTVKRTVSDAALMRMDASLSSADREKKVADVMDLLGLTAGCDGLVAKKSGGQLRRISIAMELVADLELFVLDEPDSGLDGVIAREIFTKLRAIADEGKIVIVITHTPDRVVDLFDKVIVLARNKSRVGQLAFYGSPAEARAFFGKDTMEGIVMSINRKEEGGEGRADELIQRFSLRNAAGEEKARAAL